jgi:prepilin-type N-terminal cleavage/methylation domain-containing protein
MSQKFIHKREQQNAARQRLGLRQSSAAWELEFRPKAAGSCRTPKPSGATTAPENAGYTTPRPMTNNSLLINRSAAVFNRSNPKPSARCGWGQPRSEGAFTLLELLVVIAIVAVLAVIGLSALANAQGDTQGFQCMNNHKQLMMAFRMYAGDNSDYLISCPDTGTSSVDGRPNFVNGDLTAPAGFDPAVQVNWNPKGYITPSPLYPYLSKPEVFRCPSDPVLLTVNSPPAGYRAGQYPRIRTISLNSAFGTGDWLPASNWKLYSKYGAIDMPSQIFTFIDQHPNDISDANFGIQCGPPPTVVKRAAPFHAAGHGSGLSYADGHAEIHRWQGMNIDPAYFPNNTTHYLGYGLWPSSNPNDIADVTWLASHTSVHR